MQCWLKFAPLIRNRKLAKSEMRPRHLKCLKTSLGQCSTRKNNRYGCLKSRGSHLQRCLENPHLLAGRPMVHLPPHELNNIDMIGAKAQQESEQNEEDDGVCPVTPPRPAGDGVPLGRGPQLEVDASVAERNDGERAAERNGAGYDQEVRSDARAVQVHVLHAGPPLPVLVQRAAEEQGADLKADQSPDQAAHPADHLDAPQAVQTVGVHHGQVSVQADAGHEADACRERSIGSDTWES